VTTPPTPAPGWQRWTTLAAIGAVGGVLSGAMGVGGGILMVPLLLALARMDERRAATTSLAAIVPAALVGSASYLARGQADLSLAAALAVGGMAGSLIGTRLLHRIPLPTLRWMFVGLLVLVAVRMALSVPARGTSLELTPLLVLALLGVGVFIGIASGLFGIGGGVIVVPALILLFGVDDLLAKGTSLLVMLPTAALGTVVNARAGQVDLREGVAVGLPATMMSFVGVAVAFVLPARTAAVVFAALLVVAAVRLATVALRGGRRDRPTDPLAGPGAG